jgi:hypothetical protein
MVISAGFIVISVIAPAPPIALSFAANISGVSLGLGLGWLIKSIIDHILGVRGE